MLVGRENITQFLRHYWLSFRGIVRERDLYREIKSNVKSKTTALQFIIDLRKSAGHYSALLNPQDDYWNDFDPNVSIYLESLILFKVSQYRPVALAAMKYLEPTKVEKIIHDLMAISFRYTVISGLGTGNLEKIYTNTALTISRGEANTHRKVFSQLKDAYVDAATFKENFNTRKIGKASIARYIIAKINDYKEENEEKEVSRDVHKVTLEHILPQKPNEEWNKSYNGLEELAQWVDTLGNLTLIEKSINKGIGNVGFLKKNKEAYSKSELVINTELSKYESWNISNIEQRGKELADTAELCWEIKY